MNPIRALKELKDLQSATKELVEALKRIDENVSIISENQIELGTKIDTLMEKIK